MHKNNATNGYYVARREHKSGEREKRLNYLWFDTALIYLLLLSVQAFLVFCLPERFKCSPFLRHAIHCCVVKTAFIHVKQSTNSLYGTRYLCESGCGRVAYLQRSLFNCQWFSVQFLLFFVVCLHIKRILVSIGLELELCHCNWRWVTHSMQHSAYKPHMQSSFSFFLAYVIES